MPEHELSGLREACVSADRTSVLGVALDVSISLWTKTVAEAERFGAAHVVEALQFGTRRFASQPHG